MSDYDLMRRSDDFDDDDLTPEELLEELNKSDKEKYLEYYDDIKLTTKDDW